MGNQVEALNELLASNPDSTAAVLKDSGCELLWNAANAGHVEIAKILIRKGVEINCESGNPLFYACSMGRIDMVQFLLQNGALFLPNGYKQESCLHVAAGTNPDLWVEREKYDFTKIDHLAVVKILIEHGLKPTVRDQFGETPLHRAAFVQNYAIAQYLLEQGADVGARDTANGNTSLHDAVFTNKDNRTCALLLLYGANVSTKNKKGQTPFLYGQGNADTSTIRLFERYGYDPVHDFDNFGYTLLHDALRRGQFATVDYLLDHKADVNASTKRGTTPMHIAAAIRGAPGIRVLERLLKDGAHINPLDAAGHTPLFYISRFVKSDHGTYYPDTLIVNYLRRHGAKE